MLSLEILHTNVTPLTAFFHNVMSTINVFRITTITRVIREFNARLVALSPTSSSRDRSQKTSCVAVAAAIYSAPIVLRATIDYDHDCHLIGPPARNNAYPEIECRLSTQFQKSASTHDSNDTFTSLGVIEAQ